MNLLKVLSPEEILFLLLFIGVVFTAIWLSKFRDRLDMSRYMVILLSVLSMITGFLTVSLFAKMENLGNPNGGRISLFGGVFFMPIAFGLGAKISKRKISEVFDIFTIPMIVAMMCGRTSCILTGCCEGRPIPGLNGLKWPTRELELVFYLAILLYYAPRVLKRRTYGEVYPVYMMTYGIFRFIAETFRVSASTNSVFHISHIWALVSLCVGSSIYIDLHEKRKRGVR